MKQVIRFDQNVITFLQIPYISNFSTDCDSLYIMCIFSFTVCENWTCSGVLMQPNNYNCRYNLRWSWMFKIVVNFSLISFYDALDFQDFQISNKCTGCLRKNYLKNMNFIINLFEWVSDWLNSMVNGDGQCLP